MRFQENCCREKCTSDHRRCTFQSGRYSFEFMSDYDSFVVVSGDEQFQAFLLLSVFGFYYFYSILL